MNTLHKTAYLRFFDSQPIRVKLMLLIALVSATALVTSTVVLMVGDINRLRKWKVQQLSALAEVVGSNATAAISFRQKDAAEQLLASLAGRPTIRYACLLDDDQNVFAVYRRDAAGDFTSTPPGTDGHRFTRDGYLDIVLPVVEDGERLGTIHLRDTMDDLRGQVTHDLTTAAFALAVSLAITLVLSWRLQRVISQPILNLATTAERISEQGDYSIRVHRHSDDEMGVLYGQFNHMLDRIQEGESRLREARDQLGVRVQERTGQLSQANEELKQHIGERERTAKTIGEMHQKLLDSARQAGMAEIASDVLHNVGNVLNSVNVNLTLIGERLRKSESKDLNSALAIMKDHEADLATFITQDQQGKHLPAYLFASGNAIERERTELLTAAKAVAENVDHIKTIIATQQTYARTSGVTQLVSLAELLDDAIRVNADMFRRHGVQVIRDYGDLPQVTIDKHRLLQILVNVMKNAKDAMAEKGGADKPLTVRARLTDDTTIRIEIQDNGIGIPQDRLSKIFAHGFTTKQDGNGFGLHSSANAAKQMGGSLTVSSDGPGKGATFTICLPCKRV